MPMKPGPGGYKVRSYQINDRLISNNTGIYVVERLLQSGADSRLYVVNRLLQGERDDSYRYFVKQQSLSREAAERARAISNKLNQSVFSEVGTLLELTLPVIEVFEFNGDVFSLMKYYDGGMFLEDIIAEQLESMSTGDIFELFGRILRNTEKIHYLSEKGRGILHLDVHPGNIFCCNVDRDSSGGRLTVEGVRYIDFSEALEMPEGGKSCRIKEEDHRKAARGYRAAELLNISGGENEVSRGTDIFSLTAILLFMLKKKADPAYVMNDDTMYFYSDITLDDRAGERLGLDAMTLNLLNQFLYTGLSIDRGLRFNEDTRLYIKCFEDVFSSYQSFHRGKLDEVIMMGFKYSLQSIHNEYLPWERMKYLWPERQERPEGTGQPEQAEQAVLAMHKSAVRELAEQLLQPKADNRNNELHVYMFRILWDMYGRFESFFKIKPDGETKALLAATGIAIYNNLGKSVDAGPCVTLWKKNKSFISPEIVLFTATKIPGHYENILDFHTALEEAMRNVRAQRQQSKALKAIMESYYDIRYEAGSEVTKSPVYAKSLSACGRYYSFMGERDKAEQSFEKALASFKLDDAVNIKRTRGYYAHWAIEFGEEDRFRELYSGGNDWLDMLKKLCADMDKIPGYDFLIFIKGFHRFGQPGGVPEKGDVFRLFKEIIRRGDCYTQHPWGLIYRHLGSIFMETGDEGMKGWADQAFQLACRRMADDEKNFTLETIFAYHSYFIWRGYNSLTRPERDEVNVRWEELFKRMSAHGIKKNVSGDKITGAASIKAKLNILDTLFRYEFA